MNFKYVSTRACACAFITLNGSLIDRRVRKISLLSLFISLLPLLSFSSNNKKPKKVLEKKVL